MAGSSVTITKKRIGDVQETKFVWVSDSATGEASGATTYTTVGVPMRFTTVPNGGGTAPTALYDLTLVDDDGNDILNGLGADRSATATESKLNTDGLLFVASSVLTLNVSNAGNSKGGTAYLYVLNCWNEPV